MILFTILYCHNFQIRLNMSTNALRLTTQHTVSRLSSKKRLNKNLRGFFSVSLFFLSPFVDQLWIYILFLRLHSPLWCSSTIFFFSHHWMLEWGKWESRRATQKKWGDLVVTLVGIQSSDHHRLWLSWTFNFFIVGENRIFFA